MGLPALLLLAGLWLGPALTAAAQPPGGSAATLSGQPVTLVLPDVRYAVAGMPDRWLWAMLSLETAGDGLPGFRLAQWGWRDGAVDGSLTAASAEMGADGRLVVPQLHYLGPDGTVMRLWVELLLQPAATGAPSFVLHHHVTLDPVAPRPLEAFRQGVITWYDADGGGHCSFEPSPDDLDVAALSQADGLYGDATWCGACAEVQGPLGTALVRIVDSCPECAANQLDLSPQAFARVADLVDGRVAVRWRFVSCPVAGALRFRFKEGSSQWWTAVQVRNHRVPVTGLSWFDGMHWWPMQRTDYNYFVAPGGMGTGPVRLRASAAAEVMESTLPGIEPGRELEGTGQFRAPL